MLNKDSEHPAITSPKLTIDQNREKRILAGEADLLNAQGIGGKNGPKDAAASERDLMLDELSHSMTR